jgi:flagellar biosynthesis/type III secretory pathway protein FliH
MNEARKRCAQRLKTARLRARRVGHAKASAAAKAELAAEIFRCHALLQKRLEELEHGGAAAVFQVAEDVIRHELTTSSQSLAARVQKALSGLRDRNMLRIVVHPDESGALRELLLDCLSGSTHIEAGNDVEVGNARIETQVGCIELDWRPHFSLLRELLMGQTSFGNAGSLDAH